MIADIGLLVAIGVFWRMVIELPKLPPWAVAITAIGMTAVVLLALDIIAIGVEP